MLILFAAASFVGAALLFLVQPMVAKMVLPLYGGSPAVWNTAVLFFQATLLAGYLYTHATTRRLGLRRQPWLHLVALALPLVALPIALPRWAAPANGTPPALWLLYVLLGTVGLPFLLVSTTGPLLQRWFSGTDHPRAADPYFLYAAGNAGSLVGLLGYPLAVEPALNIRDQARLWTAGYVAFALLIAGCAVALRRRPGADPPGQPAAGRPREPIGWRRRLYWVGLAFLPSSLMLGVTTYLSTDIAAVPLLWVVPLSLYLLTFIVAFGRTRRRGPGRTAPLLGGLVLALLLIFNGLIPVSLWFALALHLAVFTCLAFVAHGRLAADRPAPERLTEFYLLIAVGGVLGGIFNGLIAPVVFGRLIEYPLVIGAGLLLVARAATPSPLTRRYGRLGAVIEGLAPVAAALLVVALLRLTHLERFGLLAIGALAGVAVVGYFARRPTAFAGAMIAVLAVVALRPEQTLLTKRTFFGVYRVKTAGAEHLFLHGSILHGSQRVGPGGGSEPQTYYSRSGPLGDVFARYGNSAVENNIAVVGLGTGTVAAYGRAGAQMSFYEIDPAVIAIARNPGYFTYLRGSSATIHLVAGDGRLQLAKAPAHSFGMIVLDAFSGDSIPVHLMTREAVRMYRSKLAAGGLLVFHISNGRLDLEPVVAGIARDQQLAGLVAFDARSHPAEHGVPSQWAVLASNPDTLGPLRQVGRWRPLDLRRSPVWTDGFSNIFGVLRWQ
ncbi:MAG: fused MFS/spermidine synthase [Actinomycetota bacterium]|nr:fused MFS/spermidine synthase [Actinomycetota bacterium]